MPELDARLDSILLSPRQLANRMRELGIKIAGDYAAVERLHVLGVLKGAFVFMADLGRCVRQAGGPATEFHFIRTVTYGDAIKGPGETDRCVRIEGMTQSLRGCDVLLVEDILDQGFTLSALRRHLVEDHGVLSVRLCVLLSKCLDAPTPSVAHLREMLIPDYIGFEVPDRWVAGYGLDVNEEFRDLPYIATVREEFFRS